MSGLWVYALVADAPEHPLGRGLGGEALRAIPLAGMAAVIGSLDAPPPIEEWALRGHDRAVRALADRLEAVLPARFGQWFPDEPSLAAEVGRNTERLASSLALVSGCLQMTLRVFGPRSESDAARCAEADAEPRSGTRFLLARRAERYRLPTAPGLAELRRRLAPLLRAERVERHPGRTLVASCHDLIPRRTVDAYRATVAAACLVPPWRIRSSGPWPAYAFAPEADR